MAASLSDKNIIPCAIDNRAVECYFDPLLFSQVQPASIRTVSESMFTLLRIMSGEDWTDIRYSLHNSSQEHLAVDVYHVTWIVLSSFLLLNLIVGAIVSNFEQVNRTESRKGRSDTHILNRIAKLRDELVQIEMDLQETYPKRQRLSNRSEEILTPSSLLTSSSRDS